MTNAPIILLIAIMFLNTAYYAISMISRLHISHSKKQFLYWISLTLPILGLFLAWRRSQKKL